MWLMLAQLSCILHYYCYIPTYNSEAPSQGIHFPHKCRISKEYIYNIPSTY